VNPTGEQTAAFIRALIGVVIGILSTPAVWYWFLFFPRVVRAVWATGWSESNWSPTAAGDGGDSVGVFQFRSATWADLGVGDLAGRENPFDSGRAFVAYARRGSKPLQLLTPGIAGLRAWRVLWTRGPSMEVPASLVGGWEARYMAEDSLAVRSWRAPPLVYYLAWIPVVLVWQTPVSLVLGGGLFGLYATKGKRR
jgi:hypothetical protein